MADEKKGGRGSNLSREDRAKGGRNSHGGGRSGGSTEGGSGRGGQGSKAEEGRERMSESGKKSGSK